MVKPFFSRSRPRRSLEPRSDSPSRRVASDAERLVAEAHCLEAEADSVLREDPGALPLLEVRPGPGRTRIVRVEALREAARQERSLPGRRVRLARHLLREADARYWEAAQTMAVLVRRHSSFVVRRRRLASDLNDVIQVGMLGAHAGAQRYEPTTNATFATYVFYWVKVEIDRYASSSDAVEVPGHAREAMLHVLKHRDFSNPAAASMARRARSALFETTRLDELCQLSEGKEGDRRMDRLASEELLSDDVVASRQLAGLVLEHVGCLPEVERRVIELRFGLLDDHEMLHSEIAPRIGLSRQRVSQLEAQAVKRLSRLMKDVLVDTGGVKE